MVMLVVEQNYITKCEKFVDTVLKDKSLLCGNFVKIFMVR